MYENIAVFFYIKMFLDIKTNEDTVNLYHGYE